MTKEIAGYIDKYCVCQFCNRVMEKQNTYPIDNKDIMKCPKCGREYWIEVGSLNRQFLYRDI